MRPAFVLAALAALAAGTPVASATTAPAADTLDAAADSTAIEHRVVRRFPPIEVRAPLHDLSSSQVVHPISRAALDVLPVDGLAQAVALQPGVVFDGEEVHVRGGRAGETTTYLDGLSLAEPLRHRPMDVPPSLLESVELVSGGVEARYGCGLAGVMDLRSLDPGARAAGRLRWSSDGGQDTRYDRVSARYGTPLHLLGLGVVAAGDATFDDTALPSARSWNGPTVLGMQLGWRAENRMLGAMKVAPVERPERLQLEVLASREVQRPYDPAWTLDGWVGPGLTARDPPVFSATPLPGYVRYRAADHLAITDEGRLAALLSTTVRRGRGQASLGLGWLRTRTVRSVDGRREPPGTVHHAFYSAADSFHVVWGDDPLYRESASDVVTLRTDAELASRTGDVVKAGLGATYETVSLREVDGAEILEGYLDSVREYRAHAPGAYAYAQGRWTPGTLVVNAGLRAQYFTAGPAADEETLPGNTRGFVMVSPRLGLVFPVSRRDAVSASYAHIQEAPGRDYLYDSRRAIGNRQPLGNPALGPATAVAWEAALKHVFGPDWAVQGAVFARDLYDQIAARDYAAPGLPTELRYDASGTGHVVGFEWSVFGAAGPWAQLQAHYTWMVARGYESRPEGDPYGPVRDVKSVPLGDTPLSWDRRHTITLAGAARWRERWTLAWTTSVGSPLPWTPKPRRAAFTDLALVNSERLDWSEVTNVDVGWSPRFARRLVLGLEVRNLFDHRGARLATVDGYPNVVINTTYDDYGAYRTETGRDGGAYWSQPAGAAGQWVPVNDPRLDNPPRALRFSVIADW